MAQETTYYCDLCKEKTEMSELMRINVEVSVARQSGPVTDSLSFHRREICKECVNKILPLAMPLACHLGKETEVGLSGMFKVYAK